MMCNYLYKTPKDQDIRHIHDVETYGLHIKGSTCTISYIADTKYFDGLESFYNADVLILNVVLLESKDWINHLSVNDVEKIVSSIKPKICILTHFGMSMIKEKPWVIAEKLSEKTGFKVIAASDGKLISLDKKDIF